MLWKYLIETPEQILAGTEWMNAWMREDLGETAGRNFREKKNADVFPLLGLLMKQLF